MRVLGGFGLVAGATYPLRALGLLLRSPHLWSYLAVPIALNVVLGVLLYGSIAYFGWHRLEMLTLALDREVAHLIDDLPAWLGFIDSIILGFSYLLRVLLAVALALVVGFVLVQFGSVLGSPWYGKLSEQLELKLSGEVTFVDIGIWGDIWRALLFEIKKLLLLASAWLGLLLFGLVPGVGAVVITFGGVTVAATIVCLDFLDAPLERRRLRFRQKLGIVARSFPASGSFGLVCLGLVSLPLLNLVTIPLCVAAGTLFACDRVLPTLPKPLP
ncbi:uncharacterized protein involved in cysteine biosynthesis [Rubidibacter lacunae KORDI 51-2]|uniref:Uncharacterized protein involved in cysteine biosynthesis n=1 Tax=Rubidibacter lacunae KORDI 51-2 TaxID=582515 RepID=U5DMA0_9CHRO|nr:EI24 domain-containing protein [Rubidibacter lacunae]ERN40840.1 uncharacterized protein involved in cysteine biosynthesis [Rubidibacter lacunae KORDI 51-2]